MAYEYQPYPKYLFAASGRTIIVASETEHRALGLEWAESPAGPWPEPPLEFESPAAAEEPPTTEQPDLASAPTPEPESEPESEPAPETKTRSRGRGKGRSES